MALRLPVSLRSTSRAWEIPPTDLEKLEENLKSVQKSSVSSFYAMVLSGAEKVQGADYGPGAMEEDVSLISLGSFIPPKLVHGLGARRFEDLDEQVVI